jgi:Tol biopolymer transport system component
MYSNGSGLRNLTDNVSYDMDPTWSPDGSQIAFSSGWVRNSEIYVMNADGSRPRRLTDKAASDERPAWSP